MSKKVKISKKKLDLTKGKLNMIKVIDPPKEYYDILVDLFTLADDIFDYLYIGNNKDNKYCKNCKDRVSSILNQLSELYDKVNAKSLQEILIATQEYNRVLTNRE